MFKIYIKAYAFSESDIRYLCIGMQGCVVVGSSFPVWSESNASVTTLAMEFHQIELAQLKLTPGAFTWKLSLPLREYYVMYTHIVVV